MLRPNYVKRVAIWLVVAIALVVAVYELSNIAILIGSGGD
jgi:hypothetical protein